MEKRYLVTYQANYWSSTEAPELRQETVKVAITKKLSDGDTVLMLQERINMRHSGHIRNAIVLNYWEI